MNTGQLTGIFLIFSAIGVVTMRINTYESQKEDAIPRMVFIAKDIRLGTLLFLCIFLLPIIISHPGNMIMPLDMRHLNNPVSILSFVLFGVFPVMLWVFNLYTHTSMIKLTDTSLIKTTLLRKTEILFSEIKQIKRLDPSFIQPRWCYRKAVISGNHREISFYWIWGEPDIFSLADHIEHIINH